MTTAENINVVNQVLTASEADDLLGKASGTTAQNCRRGIYRTARQSGKTWLIHRDEIGQPDPGTTWEVNTEDLGWDETPGITITIDRAPSTLTQQQWENLSEYIESTFPLTEEDRSHGLAPDSATYNFGE
jgi:hypothetical protein